jgi:hypothetical protein
LKNNPPGGINTVSTVYQFKEEILSYQKHIHFFDLGLLFEFLLSKNLK